MSNHQVEMASMPDRTLQERLRSTSASALYAEWEHTSRILREAAERIDAALAALDADFLSDSGKLNATRQALLGVEHHA